MKAITVHQPWAWAIIFAGKDTENRATNFVGSHRGRIAIHAGQNYSEHILPAAQLGNPSDVTDPVLVDAVRRVSAATPRPVLAPLPGFDRGVILGTAHLVDVHPAVLGCCTSPWAQRNELVNFHLVLADPEPATDLVPLRGKLGLWDLPHA